MSGSYEEADERYESRDDDDRPPRLPVLRKESDRPYMFVCSFARLVSGGVDGLRRVLVRCWHSCRSMSWKEDESRAIS